MEERDKFTADDFAEETIKEVEAQGRLRSVGEEKYIDFLRRYPLPLTHDALTITFPERIFMRRPDGEAVSMRTYAVGSGYKGYRELYFIERDPPELLPPGGRADDVVADDGTVRIRRYLDFGEDRRPPSEGWVPPIPYPYRASYPIESDGPGGRRAVGTFEIDFPSPSAFEERMISGGVAEANVTFRISGGGLSSAALGEPAFFPLPQEGRA